MRALLIAVLCCLPAAGQILEVSGGQSTLMDGAGGAVKAYLPHSTATISAGLANGHFAYGASDTFDWHDYQVTAGDSAFGFSVGSTGGLGEQVRGLTIARQRPTSTLAAFAGMTGQGFAFPFFAAVKAQHVGAGLYYQQRAGRWQFSSLVASSGNLRTAVGSAAYSDSVFHLSASGGLLSNKGTATGSAIFQPSTHFSVSATRQDLLWQGLRASVDSAGAFTSVGHFTLQGSALHSTSNGRLIVGQSAGAGARLGFLSLQANAYRSAGQLMLAQSASENLRHWQFTQTLSQSGGQRSYGGGAGYQGNSLSVSVGQSVQFLPFGRGWAKVTSVTLAFHVPHTDTAVNLAVSLLPTGPEYTANGDSFVRGPVNIESSKGGHTHSGKAGRYLLQGTVVNRKGEPVSGAAVALGNTTVFSNSTGNFFVRQRRAKAVFVRVLLDQFEQPGAWVVVAAPDTAQPGTAISIVVEAN